MLNTLFAANGDEDFRPIPGVHGKIAKINSNSRSQRILSGVPAYNWAFGCAATSAAMLIGYYDRHGFPNMFVPDPPYNDIAPLTNQDWNNIYGSVSISDYNVCPISATEQNVLGRSTRGSANDYYRVAGDNTDDPYYNHWTEHSYADISRCSADYLGTSQHNHFNRSDGGTAASILSNGTKRYWDQTVNYQTTLGTLGMAYYINNIPDTQIAQCYVQARDGSQASGINISGGFTYEDFKNEIDNLRPILLSLKAPKPNGAYAGHSVLAFGYNDDSVNNQIVYFYDTADYQMHYMNWDGNYTYANKNYFIHAVTVVIPDGPVGIEDYIAITNDVSNFNQNSYQTFNAIFSDANPENPPDYIVTWSWELKAYHENGTYVINQATTTGNNSSSWSVNIPNLSINYNWLRDQNGSVKCELILLATDSDNINHSIVKDIGINKEPSTAQILGIYQNDNIVNFNTSNVGATGYYLYYDTNSGFPYSGTGAVEGSSPVFFNAYDDIKLTGLTPNKTWHFCIKGINGIGEGPYSQNYSQYVQVGNFINQSTQWSGNIILSHPLTLTSTGSITIADNSIITLSDNGSIECNLGSSLQIGNNVTIKGSKVTVIHDETSPIWTDYGNKIVVNGGFSAGTNVKFTVNGTDFWDGLYLNNNVTKTFDASEFKNCNLYNKKGSINISNSSFFNSSIINYNANFSLQNSNINGIVFCENTGTNYLSSNITNCTISGSDDGVLLSGRMNYQISDCNISNNTGVGINIYQVTGTTTLIKNSIINNNSSTGIRFYASQGIVQSCNIRQNQRGILAYRSSMVEIKKDPNSQPWTHDSILTDNDYEELYFFNDCTMILDGNRNKIMDNDTYYLVNCPNASYNR